MKDEQRTQQDYLVSLDAPRQQAVAELTALVRRRYPTASFTVVPGEDDADGTYIMVTVDTDDPDDEKAAGGKRRPGSHPRSGR